MGKIWKCSVGLYSKTNKQFFIFFMNWKKLRSPARAIFKNPKISKVAGYKITKKRLHRQRWYGIMQYTTDFQKCLLSFFGRLCKICFPEFCSMVFPFYINLIANKCRRNKATPYWNLVFILHNETVVFKSFGRNFDLFWRSSLDSTLRGFFQFCIMFMAFFRRIFVNMYLLKVISV